MKSHFRLSFAFAFVFALSFSTAAIAQDAPAVADAPRAGLPPGTGATCLNKKANAVELDKKMRNDKVAQGCRDEVKTAYETCGTPPLDDQTGAVVPGAGPSMVQGAQSLKAKAAVSSAKNTEKAAQCTAVQRQMTNRCNEITRGLDQAARTNQESMRTQMAARPQARALIMQEHHAIATDLQRQKLATSEMQTAAEKALSELGRCYADHARTADHNYGLAHDTLVNAGGGEAAGDNARVASETNSALTPQRDSPDVEVGKGIATDLAKSEAQNAAARTVAARTGLSAMVSSDSLIAKGANMQFGRTAGLLSAGPMLAATFYFSSTVPAGACSEVYTSALRADAQGCALNVRAAAHALRAP